MPKVSPETPLSDIMAGTLSLLFRRGLCLGRVYSIGLWHKATGEISIAVLNLQGVVCHEEPTENAFEAARRFAELESAVPLGVRDHIKPQYESEGLT